MKQLHAYITQALEEVQACIYYNQALCFGEASATVASTRAHQPAETASDPLKHELQNTRLQASASAYAIRVHQLALEPASDNILTKKAKLYRFHAVESITVQAKQRLRFIKVDFST